MPSQIKGISKRARALLKGGESKAVDYKENVKGLHAEDLVSFANSEDGGAILVGVKESNDKNGGQIGIPLGHAVSDEVRLQIMGKALSCAPPVSLEIYVENVGDKPFYRIEIPSGAQKPYATNGGTYKIREDGRNGPLLPPQLLKMFLERESDTFSKRFSEATHQLEAKMSDALGSVGDLEDAITSKIDQIASSMGWAEYKASDAADTIDTVKSYVDSILDISRQNTKRLRAISRKVEANDPLRAKAEEALKADLKNHLEKNPETLKALAEGQALSVEVSGPQAEELTKEDMSRLLSEVIKEMAAAKSGGG